MDWDKLKVFYSVAECGSFTKAAITLDISQSAISRQISRLEEMLSTPLFYRHARGLTLTEQGETLFKTTREVFSELTLAEREIKTSAYEVIGSLTIVSPVAFGNSWMIPKLPEFLENYPYLQLVLKFSDSAVDLRTYDADVSISGIEGDGETVLSHHLITVPMRIYSSKEYLLDNGVPMTAKQLDAHKLLVFGDDPVPDATDPDCLLKLGRPVGELREAYGSINNVYTLARMVAGGVGIAMLPRDVADHCPGLVQIMPDADLPKGTLYYSYAKQLAHSKAVVAFYDFISKKVAEQNEATKLKEISH